jgi:predicted DNA-binding transcriptional regulator AlpA
LPDAACGRMRYQMDGPPRHPVQCKAMASGASPRPGNRRDANGAEVPTLVTVEEFSRMARLSRRQIDRLRKARAEGFPQELELGSGGSKHRRCPRFRLRDVEAWLDSRALW